MLDTGSSAPAFSVPDENGNLVSLADFGGQNVVLYFYPKDSTPGCTTEAIDFTNLKAEFEKSNTVVIGVSKDSQKRHQNFIAKNDLGITLLADEDGSLCENYGVWVEKKNYGRSYMGIERSTFLIGADGKIKQIWRKVRVKGHADAVLAAVQAL